MRLRTHKTGTSAGHAKSATNAGFTLAEVLAALVFMAIVIPVAIEGLHIAGKAGQSAERRVVAARIGQQVLGELLANGQWQQTSQKGSVRENMIDYQWQARLQTWTKNTITMQLLSLNVTYPVQGQDCEVHLTTLVGTTSN